MFYLHPPDRLFEADVSLPDVKSAFLELVERALSEDAVGRAAWAVFDLVRRVLKARRTKIAVIADDWRAVRRGEEVARRGGRGPRRALRARADPADGEAC